MTSVNTTKGSLYDFSQYPIQPKKKTRCENFCIACENVCCCAGQLICTFPWTLLICYVGVLISMSMGANAGTDVKNWANSVDFGEIADLVENMINVGTALYISLDLVVLATSVVQFWFGDNVNALFNKCCCCCNCFGHCCWANACFYQWLLLCTFVFQYAANILAVIIFTSAAVILVLFYIIDGTCQVSINTVEDILKKLADMKEFEHLFDLKDLSNTDAKTWEKICDTVDDAAQDVEKLCLSLLVLIIIQVAFVVASRSNYVSSKFQVQLARKMEKEDQLLADHNDDVNNYYI